MKSFWSSLRLMGLRGSVTDGHLAIFAGTDGTVVDGGAPGGGGGTVTNTGTLTADQLLLGNGGVDIKTLGSTGTSTTVLHGGAPPTFGAVSLTADVTGTLPIANGGTNSATALSGSSIIVSNGSAIVQGTAGTTTTVLHGNAAGTPTYAAVSLTADVTGNLPIANLGNGTFSYNTISVTGTNDNFNAGILGNTYIEWSGASDATFTGFTNGAQGKLIIFRNASSKVAYFAYNSGSSSVGNKFINLVTSSTTPVAPGGWISYTYSGGKWVLVGHEQGDYITPGFSGGNFTLNGDRTWTVDSGDVNSYIWKLTGRTIQVIWALYTTTISGGTSSTNAQIAIPNSFTSLSEVLMLSSYMSLAGVVQTGYSFVSPTATLILVAKNDQTDLGTGTNNMYFWGQNTFPVT